MFTGIVEEVGKIKNIKQGSASAVLTISADRILEDVNLGDSIAVNGVCLTVTKFTSSEFTVDVMHETLKRSSLDNMHAGTKVNLERAMPANGRFGGHIVSGHIDGTGTITAIEKDDNARWYTVKTEPGIIKYIIEKGSVAIDGISLTVAYVDNETFKVSIIPHTMGNTILPEKNIGSTVNLENDIIGKYVEKLFIPNKENFYNSRHEKENNKKGITKEFLNKYGF